MKLVLGFPVFFAAEQRAIVGEEREIASVKKKFSMTFLNGSPPTQRNRPRTSTPKAGLK